MTTARLSLLFRVDAVANAAMAAAAVALLLAPELLGLPRWALGAVAGFGLLNAADLWRTGRQPTPRPTAVRRAGAVDLAFAAVFLAVAATGLQGQSDAARWILAAFADVALLVGVLKLLGVRSAALATA